MATVLITGTSRGIGYVTALALARAGHTVYATMRDPGRAKEFEAECRQEGLPVHVSVMDVDSDESVAAAMAAICEAAGNIDVLVNNAGVARSGPMEEVAMADFRAPMETNYFGAVRCMKAVIPQMRVRRSGCIINVTSVSGRIAVSPLGPYAASKWALEAVSEALAQEMKAFNVRVAIVEPGIIDTGMAQGLGKPLPPSPYPQQRRMAHFFAASLSNPTQPAMVAETIQNIIENGTWQLRHPVGPDSAPILESRKAVSDEEFVALHAADDDTWYSAMEELTGKAIRPKNQG